MNERGHNPEHERALAKAREATEPSPRDRGEVGNLAVDPEDANADALKVYPRERYEAARDGRISLGEFADDLREHVRAQTAPRPRTDSSRRNSRPSN
jgi:hypothetical protein